jgi:OOP family OmpA-OmpF porin
MKKVLRMALLGAALVTPFAAQAEDAYVKFAVGQSAYEGTDYGTFNQTGYLLGLGMAVDKNWDVEIGYADLGKSAKKEGVESISIKDSVFYAAGIGKYAVTDTFNIYGKLGIGFNRAEATATSGALSATEKESATRVLYGIGASYNFTKEIAGVIDYTKYASDISFLSAGVRYGF